MAPIIIGARSSLPADAEARANALQPARRILLAGEALKPVGGEGDVGDFGSNRDDVSSLISLGIPDFERAKHVGRHHLSGVGMKRESHHRCRVAPESPLFDSGPRVPQSDRLIRRATREVSSVATPGYCSNITLMPEQDFPFPSITGIVQDDRVLSSHAEKLSVRREGDGERLRRHSEQGATFA